MKIHLNPNLKQFRNFAERLPETFDLEGETLHDGRNRIKAFDVGGDRLVVKRYKRPNAFNTLIYSFFRKSKARRAYEHARRLQALGIGTPQPVAWCECRRRGVIRDTYLITRRTADRAITGLTQRFPEPDTLPPLSAFAAFVVRLHALGVEHKDFNHSNILWHSDPATGQYAFQLIDINRMRLHRRPLRPRACMVNLRRLACPAGAFLYILDRYAEQRGWNVDETLLRGTFFRLLFGRRQQFKRRFRHRCPEPQPASESSATGSAK